jgi:hypothetical protein
MICPTTKAECVRQIGTTGKSGGVGEISQASSKCCILVIACDKREAFAHGSNATKQSRIISWNGWIASLRSQ